MDSCLFAVLIMFLSRVDLRNGNDCLSLKMVSLIGLRLFIFLQRFCPLEGRYTIRFLRLLKIIHVSSNLLYRSRRHNNLSEIFPKIVLKFFVDISFSSPLFKPSKKHSVTISSLKIFTYD